MFEENNFNSQQNDFQHQAIEQPVLQQPQNAYGFIPLDYSEKKDIRRTALAIGIPCLCLLVISFLWSFVYIFITTNIIQMSYEEAVKLTENPAVQQILQITLSCLMFLLPFSIAAKAMGNRIDNLIMFNKDKRHKILPYIIFGVGFCSFSNIAMSYADQIFQNFGVEYEVDFGDNPSGIFGFLLSFIATAIVPALVEEFACRGIVLGLLKKYGEGFAIITSSIVFGIMHGNFEQIPFAVMVGLILGYVYVKTGNIWTSVIIHSINNAVSVIFTYLQNEIGTQMQNILYILYLIISMLIGILGVYFLSKDDNEEYALEKNEDTVSTKKKYIWFFTSWSIIVFIILNFIESLTYFVL